MVMFFNASWRFVMNAEVIIAHVFSAPVSPWHTAVSDPGIHWHQSDMKLKAAATVFIPLSIATFHLDPLRISNGVWLIEF